MSRLILVMGILVSVNLSAHNLNFGTLTLSESVSVANQFQLTFQVSGDQGSHSDSSIGLPLGCEVIKTQAKTDKIRRRVMQTFECDTAGFENKSFQFLSMPPNATILVRALSGNALLDEQMLPGDTPDWQLSDGHSQYVFSNYIKLGVIHILVGWDHLLFLVMLMLLIPAGWTLVQVITAFTVGHSITLGMATFGLIQVPVAPTEALIALSIVFLAAEIIRYHRDRVQTLTLIYPGLITALFGLFHGLGFASVLNDIGVPEDQLVWSLVGFNIGVELGQLLFVSALLLLVKCLAFWRVKVMPSKSVLAYVGGAMGAFWLVERVAGF